MSKTVTIPTVGANPFVIRVGGKEYSYPAGTQQTVPDAVADVIENVKRLAPQEDPNAGDLRPATIGDVKALIAAGGGSGGGSSDLRVPFTLQVDAKTGTASATTTADFDEVCAAIGENKLVWADVVQNGESVDGHIRGIMIGNIADDGPKKLYVFVTDAVGGGSAIGVYKLRWQSSGCDVSVYTLTTT